MPSPPSGSHGTRAGRRLHGAGLLRGATGQEAWAGEAGAGIRSPGRQGPTHGWRPDPRRRQQLGAGTTERGWSSTWPQKHWLGTPDACLAPARASLPVNLSPVDSRVARARSAARGGGSRERGYRHDFAESGCFRQLDSRHSRGAGVCGGKAEI